MKSTTQAIVKTSRYSYADTISRLSDAITSSGNRIFVTIDQSAAAADAALILRPTSLIVFGNPMGGTHLMDAFPLLALDLPLKLLVWQVQERVMVAYVPMSEIVARYDVTGVDEQIAAMDRALDTVTAAVQA